MSEEGLIILKPRHLWEKCNFIKFSKEQLDKAEISKDGVIGEFCGMRCVLIKYIREEDRRG
jgi:hypothetical protein